MILSAQQRAAAARTGQDVCIVAGPGSGKTRVLIHRFAWLVRERKIPAGRILAITFTEKATNEIKKRLVAEFASEPELRPAIERAWVSTVDGFCARLLRENAIAAGIDPAFGILEASESNAELRQAAVAVLDALFAQQPEQMRGLLNAIHVSAYSGSFAPDLVEALVSVYGALRIAGQDPAKMPPLSVPPLSAAAPVDALQALLTGGIKGDTPPRRQRIEAIGSWVDRARALAGAPLSADHFALWRDNLCNLRGVPASDPVSQTVKTCREQLDRLRSEAAGVYYQQERALVAEAVRRLDTHYRQSKAVRSLLDFGDLQERAIHLLEGHPEVRRRIQASFDQILMDELQDTNPLQWRLVDLLRRPDQFFAVGDINQSIYGFRHADPAVFEHYHQQLESNGGIIDRLNDNYRSRAPILEVVDRVLAGQPGIEPNPLNAKGSFPESDDPAVEFHCSKADNTETAAQIEASWIARRIREMEGSLMVGRAGEQRPARFSDMAILARTAAALEPVREALGQSGVPHLLIGGRSYFENPEIRDLVHWLEILSNPSNEIALAGVLRSPIAGVSDETLLRIRERDTSLLDSLERAVTGNPFECDSDGLARLRWFHDLLSAQRRVRDSCPPDRLLAEMLDESGYEHSLTPAARRNTDKFLALLRDRFASSPLPMAELLDDLRSARLAGAEPDAPPDDASNAVTLLSMHRSKGLEFPIVILCALHKDRSHQTPPISYSPAAGLGVKWRDPSDPGAGIDDLAYRAHRDEVSSREQTEENRLLYVAMTRAEEHLMLSYATRNERAEPANLARLVASGLKAIQICHQEQAPNDFPAVAVASESTPRLAQRAGASDQSDSSITVSALAAFRDCPRRYYLSRYLGIEPEPAVMEDAGPAAQPATALGSEVHALLAGEAVDKPHPLAAELAAVFYQSELGRRAARAVRVEREFEVLMAVEDVVVRGTIDLWFEEGGEIILVDYKTDRTKPEEDAASGYAIQLRLYALALRAVTGKLPALAVLFYLRRNEAVRVSLSEADLIDAKAAIKDLREAQNRLDFPVRPAGHCKYCPHHRTICPSP